MASAIRPPIVAVMGHIDHGKSTLLDYIRKTNVTGSEAGGITQHVSAYEAVHVPTEAGKLAGELERKITFLDTPGHEAFRTLRARGAHAADVAILVVAADEGVKPQTLEALSAILEAGIPYVVALTKIDKNGADIEHAKTSLLENGVYLEGLGGSIPFAAVSSKSGEGVPELLDLVLLTADLAEFTADAALPGTGFVLESTQDPRQGLSATLIVKNGTVRTGTYVVAGAAYAPVRFIENFAGKRVKEAGPSIPARVSGWNELPPAGTPFQCVETRKDAEANAKAFKVAAPNIAVTPTDESGRMVLPLIVKADVTGSIEAIQHELAKVVRDDVVIQVLTASVGAVTDGDVKTASAASGVVIAFNVTTDAAARELAERANIPIETFTIIYDLGKRVAELMLERAPKVDREEVLGEASVIRVFSATARRAVLGARLAKGAFAVGNLVHVVRRDEDLGRAKVVNLQQARADVSEIRTEGDFGMQLETKIELAQGDRLTAFKIIEA